MRGLAEQLGNYATAGSNTNNNRGADDNADAFEPPVDVFNTDRAYIMHVALPGAKKEDIGVSWDPEAGVLRIAGVIHRPGDEAFLQTLATAERRVGMFERAIPLPPAGSAAKDEIDGYGITAKMEDGVLVVTVPKAEKEWTEVHKVDIE
jgi:HSP20 family protein